jgi:citrate lyase synthetase
MPVLVMKTHITYLQLIRHSGFHHVAHVPPILAFLENAV